MSKRWPASSDVILLTLILLLAFGLRTAYLTQDRFHADEALYAGWALRVLDGDPLLLGVPVDKPPLFLYALAGAFSAFGSSELAARWINLACSMVSIVLIHRFARASNLSVWPDHGRSASWDAAIWATLFLALSPFDILFARTAFTDTMLVMWILAALCATVQGRWFWSGLFVGLAFATKQQAVILLPLLVAIATLQPVRRRTASPRWRSMLAAAHGFCVPWGLVTWWDSARWEIRPGYWQQSALSYGGLIASSFNAWAARFAEWLSWARFLTGSTVLGALYVVGVLVLLIWEWRWHPRARQTWLDTLWAAFTVVYFLVHVAWNFAIWDRYLLPLAVPVVLLAARMVTLFRHARPVVRRIILLLSIVVSLAVAIRAATNGYPIGGEHWAYQGIDQVAAYLKKNAAPDAVLYHHWLRWHYTYYLHGTDFELRWWQDGKHLCQEARKSPDREQYIVLPDWRPLDPSTDGVRFVPLLQTWRDDGSVSLQLYQIALEPW
jgi:4-amino-4-deoxy-L-arabinose transferase-like glycosyltransferase